MRTLTELPGPRGLPLLGNLLQLNLKQLHRVLERWCDEFGTICVFRLGRRPVVVVADPEVMQQILKGRPKLYRRLDTIESVFKEMGIEGVFSVEGQDWQRQRRLTVHALDASHLRDFMPTLVKVTERLKNRWNRAADTRATVDIQQDLMRYTVDVTTNLAFGYDMNTLENDGDVIQQHLEKILPMINRRINAPIAYWRHFRLRDDRSLDRSLVAIRETITGFVTRGRARLAADPRLAAQPTNLLEAMLAARDEDGAEFTDEEVYGNVLTMLLAGEDTTANTMAWMMHFMTEHPQVQARMLAEAEQVVGRSGTLTDLKDVARLVYIDSVAQEAMRLKPVAPIIFLESLEDVEFGSVAVAKGTALMLLTMHAGLQDVHFAAADQFRPERWLEAAAASRSAAELPAHDAKAFLPFGAGPRFCPGRQLAMVEIKTVMAMLCASFEIMKTEPVEPVSELFSFTMMPEGLFVRLMRRAAG
jgi:cytochrome P450